MVKRVKVHGKALKMLRALEIEEDRIFRRGDFGTNDFSKFSLESEEKVKKDK